VRPEPPPISLQRHSAEGAFTFFFAAFSRATSGHTSGGIRLYVCYASNHSSQRGDGPWRYAGIVT
jgi:hypothetical protein